MINTTAQKYINNITDICRRRKPLVVIRSITYNHERYLRDALDGFVMQKTDFPFVVIVHDDASTDNTASILREYTEKYPDIILPIFESENQYSRQDGSLGRIIRAAQDSTGAKYIALCEGDDYWIDPYKLQKQVDYMESHPECFFCFTDINFKFETSDEYVNNVFQSGYKKLPLNFEEHLINESYLAPPTWLIRRSEYPELSGNFVDGTFAISLELFAKSKPICINEATAVYRINPGGVTQSKDANGYFQRKIGLIKIQKVFIDRYPQYISNKINKIIFWKLLKLIPIASIINQTEILEYLFQSLFSVPKRLSKPTIRIFKMTIIKAIFAKYYHYKRIRI